MKTFLLYLLVLLTVSCASVNIELKPYSEQSTSFVHYSHYGLWGLVGSDSINLEQACIDGEPVQVRNHFSFEDFLFAVSTVGLSALGIAFFYGPMVFFYSPPIYSLLAVSTFGLYSPKSTEIWCEIPHQDDVIKL